MSDLHDDFERSEIASRVRARWLEMMATVWPRPVTRAEAEGMQNVWPYTQPAPKWELTERDRALLAEVGIKAEE